MTESRKLQLLQVDILSDIDKTCEENGLTYYMICGTLLGAVRHKGFIPWDDDTDICMFENNNCAHIASDYEELKDVLKKCVDSREYRYKYTENAKATALKNHNSEENAKIMENIIGRL